MAAAAERIHLFYGTDSWASLQALHTWVSLFQKKYGEATFYSIEADELPADEVYKKVAAILQTDALFALPKLLLIKRLSSQAKASRFSNIERVLEVIESQLPTLDATTTILFWEPRDLSPAQPILKKMQEWSAQQKARLYPFNLPTAATLGKTVGKYLAPLGLEVEAKALNWLREQYLFREQEQRIQNRLKSGEMLSEDYRGWWLRQLLETTFLLTENSPITLSSFERAQTRVEATLSPFSLSDAFLRGEWQQALYLLDQAQKQGQDDSFYFGLLAIVRSQVERRSSLSARKRRQLLQLIAEVELISKNTALAPEIVCTLLVLRMREGSTENLSLIDSRKLWLSTLAR